jgi:hypothetical protein
MTPEDDRRIAAVELAVRDLKDVPAQLAAVLEILPRIEAQTTKTNGRVTGHDGRLAAIDLTLAADKARDEESVKAVASDLAKADRDERRKQWAIGLAVAVLVVLLAAYLGHHWPTTPVTK